MLNGVYDKFFLGKIASKYVLAVLAKVDWKKTLKDNDVPHTDEMFESLEKVQEFLKNLETYSSEEKLKELGSEVGDELKDQGKNLWNKASELLEETDEN